MPFDALMMRAVEHRWQTWLVGRTLIRVQCGRDRILWTVRGPGGETDHLLWVLQPGIARVHRTSAANLASKTATPPWLLQILPGRIDDVSVPVLERVMYLRLTAEDDWDQPATFTVVIELAGHLTNLILIGADNLIVDAWRKIGPGRPGRTVWPRLPYVPPPSPGSSGFDSSAFPPWARRWIEQGGQPDQLRRDWIDGFPAGAVVLTAPDMYDVWMYPMAGFAAAPEPDLERALDRIYSKKEQQRLEDQLRDQLVSQIQNRIHHLRMKVSDYHSDLQEDEAEHKYAGDLWLAYQTQFPTPTGPAEIIVDGFHGESVSLHLTDGETPVEKARAAYRRYKKVKARKDALARIIPIFEREMAELAALLADAQSGSHAPEWYRAQLQKNRRRENETHEREPFRHFISIHGLDIWVGRNRDENAAVTFKKARPDDMWLHAKQSPGSHVVLGCGRKNPDLEDLLDAAELAVFFSSAAQSSTVPVDYTRRKFVKKRPHAEPGQVLYQRERTLYITPDGHRLRRLGAISEKLVDDHA